MKGVIQMLDLKTQKEKIIELANNHTSSQIETYKDSIFLPYITLPNAKGKGAMMEEFFAWYLNELGISTKLIKTNENYDFIINDKTKVELKVASIGYNNMVVFNQIHFGISREVDKFLFTIIKPNNEIDFFVIPKIDFILNEVKVQKQHSGSKEDCARINWTYTRMVKELEKYKVDIDKLKEAII